MGIDWWVNNPSFCGGAKTQNQEVEGSLARIEERLANLESSKVNVPG
jgi:hypothetical protein